MTTTLKTIEERIQAILGEQFGVAAEHVKLAANLHVEYGGDSLDVVELTMAVEDEFNFEIPDEQMHKFTTGQEIVNYVRANAK